ncbi:MAG: family 10 glycosylhydrolase [Phycisphaerae bacterium]|nr:family 10 glycosylhydrolase [Phycisphaerae bacterium]
MHQHDGSGPPDSASGTRTAMVCLSFVFAAVLGACVQTPTGEWVPIGQEPAKTTPPPPHSQAEPAPPVKQRKPKATGPMRAIWVTRFDYRTASDIQRIMANCQELGATAVFFQVRAAGTAYYRSRLEPWTDDLGGADPGFDPLEIAVSEAHDQGLELHAWVNVMPGWCGPRPPSNPRQLYNVRPQWFWYDQNGKRQPLTRRGSDEGWYVSLNPCLPEVRKYLVSVCEEIVSGYEVDGLHLDYVRFPNDEAPRGSDYPRDRETLALYKKATGKKPADDRAAWARWRTDQVSALVRDIRAMVRRARPRARLSAAVGPDPAEALTAHFQDGPAWLRNGWVDFLSPMNYTADVALFTRRADAWRQRAAGRPVVMGVGIYTHNAPAESVRQVELARQWRHGCALFSYAALFPPGAGGAQQARLDALRPVFARMAKDPS